MAQVSRSWKKLKMLPRNTIFVLNARIGRLEREALEGQTPPSRRRQILIEDVAESQKLRQ